MSKSKGIKDGALVGDWKSEEQYILRVRDPDLAERIRKVLQEDADDVKKLEIKFTNDPHNGKLLFEGKEYSLTVLNMPSVSEIYKTYDDINLVKAGDIGQVLVVGDITNEEAITGEMKDGITPPMRNARERLFRKPIPVQPEAVKKVEEQLLHVLRGNAPEGFKFVDHEEIWQIDEATGIGRWVPTK